MLNSFAFEFRLPKYIYELQFTTCHILNIVTSIEYQLFRYLHVRDSKCDRIVAGVTNYSKIDGVDNNSLSR